MEKINRFHNDITHNRRVLLSAYFKIQNDKVIYLSAGAVIRFGLIAGRFAHFENDEHRWYFYTNDDPDGFALVKRNSKNSVIICNASLIALIKARTRISTGTKFLIVGTTALVNGTTLLEINFNKPLELGHKLT